MNIADLSGKIFVKSLSALSISLLLSTHSVANTKTFSLLNMAGEQVGTVSLYRQPNAQAEIRASMHENTYIGVGKINKRLHNYTKAMQSNRGKLPQQERQHLMVELSAENRLAMTCDLGLYYGKLSGQCTNPSSEVFFVR